MKKTATFYRFLIGAIFAVGLFCLGCSDTEPVQSKSTDPIVGLWNSVENPFTLALYSNLRYRYYRKRTLDTGGSVTDVESGRWRVYSTKNRSRRLRLIPFHVTTPSGQMLDIRGLIEERRYELAELREDQFQLRDENEQRETFELVDISKVVSDETGVKITELRRRETSIIEIAAQLELPPAVVDWKLATGN